MGAQNIFWIFVMGAQLHKNILWFLLGSSDFVMGAQNRFNIIFFLQQEIKITGVTVFVNPYTEPDEEEEQPKEEEKAPDPDLVMQWAIIRNFHFYPHLLCLYLFCHWPGRGRLMVQQSGFSSGSSKWVSTRRWWSGQVLEVKSAAC